MVTQLGTFQQSECWHPKRQPAIATIYYISFVIIASFIVLSLFIGAVCSGMAEALDEFEAEEERAKIEAKAKIERIKNPDAAFISVLVHLCMFFNTFPFFTTPLSKSLIFSTRWTMMGAAR